VEYFTFIASTDVWRLHRGLSEAGPVVTERHQALPVLDFDAAEVPTIWAIAYSERADRPTLVRVSLVDLTFESIPWTGGRLGAVACSAQGAQVVVLRLPSGIDDRVTLWSWSGGDWSELDTAIAPDISSKLAWLGAGQIVYESHRRQLTVVDLATGRIQSGPEGSLPAASRTDDQWIAFSQGRVQRFSGDQPFAGSPVTDFEIGEVSTLRLSGDGRVCTWSEPIVPKRSKGYIQERGGHAQRFRAIDDGVARGAVVGPYDVQPG
jgi:hypothetical protein